ncbi:MAG: 16S rRNA (guanine(527)-N(7))-methyltransferase RsmG [Bacteroidales bacterium]|nr:16S rRNA (guanine(527)-N(7))-methyltransferase RsmG [Bacteroidales bacterium]
MDHALINHYFPHLSPLQQQQFAALGPCYQSWNARINVISRKDIDRLYLHHVLHSLAIARFTSFPDGTSVLDVGTGGGFPGIPLAIMFPQVHFFLCDSIAKKIRVVNEVVTALGLKNVSAAQIRVEEIMQPFDYVICRAVAPLRELLDWVWGKTTKGVICLKGGDLKEEVAACNPIVGEIEEISVSQWFKEPFFEGKMVIFIKKRY